MVASFLGQAAYRINNSMYPISQRMSPCGSLLSNLQKGPLPSPDLSSPLWSSNQSWAALWVIRTSVLIAVHSDLWSLYTVVGSDDRDLSKVLVIYTSWRLV